MDLNQLTGKVCSIARKAGNYLRQESENFDPEKIIEKKEHDYVSYVDQQTEKLLIADLSSLLPAAGFITEEGFGVFSDEEYCWVIDPLDGTTNFIHGNPPYCVSIALKKEDEILIGVVYEVSRQECFYAYKGGGAFLNGKPIHVSTNRVIDNALIGLDLPYNVTDYKPVINYLVDELYGKASSVRINGSAATALCYVACGRYDAWLEAYIKCWDYAAGILIISEAGGKITDFHDADLQFGNHHLIATNGHLHPYFVELIKPFAKNLE